MYYRIQQPILSSIALRPQIKRFLRKKFEWLNKHNGAKFTTNIFKQMLDTCLLYRSDRHRHLNSNFAYYMGLMPIDNKTVKKYLLRSMESNPTNVINMLKIYTSYKQPVQTEQEALRVLLEEVKGGTDNVPELICSWVQFLKGPKPKDDLQASYWIKWRKIFYIPSCDPPDEALVPHPAMYKDCYRRRGVDYLVSDSFVRDLEEYWAKTQDSTFARRIAEIPHWLDALDRIEGLHINAIMDHGLGTTRPYPAYFTGRVHFIPKTGGIKWRPIVAPNRVLQLLLSGLGRSLQSILKRMPQDCTHNQSMLDQRIQTVQSQGDYVGCVDLHAATEHIPYSWALYALNNLSPSLSKELSFFEDYIAKGTFLAEFPGCNHEIVRWQTGQPLGSIPSFPILGICNNVLIESICFRLGILDSPYGVLGDDTIFFSEMVRQAYMLTLKDYRIPISVHKSYEHKLVEFAGKVYVPNVKPFHKTDQKAVSFTNLFDWQLATNIPIPFKHLDPHLQYKWTKACIPHLATTKLGNLNFVVSAYKLVQMIYGLIPSRPGYDDCITTFFMFDGDENLSPDRKRSEFIVYQHKAYRIGVYSKGRVPETSKEWFKAKFRPYTTHYLASVASRAISTNLLLEGDPRIWVEA